MAEQDGKTAQQQGHDAGSSKVVDSERTWPGCGAEGIHSKEALAMVQELRTTIDAEWKDATDAEKAWLTDGCLRRYIRARKGDVAAAARQLLETLQWRRDFGVYDMVPETFRGDMEEGKMYVSPKQDKHGHPLVMNRKSKTPSNSHDRALAFLVYNLEKATRIADQHGQEKWVWFMDLKHYSRGNSPPWHITKQTIHIMQTHYPERLYHLFVVDAPFVFKALWTMAYPFIDADTHGKITFVTNGDSHHDAAKFLEYIDADCLEADYGGAYDFTYNFDEQELGGVPAPAAVGATEPAAGAAAS